MENVTDLWSLLLVVTVLLIALAIRRAVRRAGERRERDRTRTFETLLLPKETVKCSCRSHGKIWHLTNKRLIIEQGGSYTALPFKKIKKTAGKNAAGKTTSSPAKMVSLTVTAERDFTLYSGDPGFPDFVRQLREKTAKKKKTKK